MKLIKKIKDKIVKKIKDIKEKIKERKRWRVYLYYNNRFIKKVYIKNDDKNEDFKPLSELYIIRVFFRKYLFGAWNVKVICQAKNKGLKYINADKKEVHIEIQMFGGV